jgi:hypothetical protein
VGTSGGNRCPSPCSCADRKGGDLLERSSAPSSSRPARKEPRMSTCRGGSRVSMSTSQRSTIRACQCRGRRRAETSPAYSTRRHGAAASTARPVGQARGRRHGSCLSGNRLVTSVTGYGLRSVSTGGYVRTASAPASATGKIAKRSCSCSSEPDDSLSAALAAGPVERPQPPRPAIPYATNR